MSKKRVEIQLPDGRVLVPRAAFAQEIGTSERTVTRLNPPTTYVGNVAYVERIGSLQLIAAGVRRRNQPRSNQPRPTIKRKKSTA